MPKKPKLLTYEEYQEKVNSLKTMGDVNSFVKDLIGPTIQAMLDAEMEKHLGYKKYEAEGRNSGNSRNGSYEKTLRTNHGETTIEVPRDREDTFDPLVVKKYETVESGVEEKSYPCMQKG